MVYEYDNHTVCAITIKYTVFFYYYEGVQAILWLNVTETN